MYVFQITEHQTTLSHDQIYKRDISKDFIGISLCLNFNNLDSNELFILDEFQIYSFNYIEENIQIIFRFNYELSSSPEIVCYN